MGGGVCRGRFTAAPGERRAAGYLPGEPASPPPPEASANCAPESSIGVSSSVHSRPEGASSPFSGSARFYRTAI